MIEPLRLLSHGKFSRIEFHPLLVIVMQYRLKASHFSPKISKFFVSKGQNCYKNCLENTGLNLSRVRYLPEAKADSPGRAQF